MNKCAIYIQVPQGIIDPYLSLESQKALAMETIMSRGWDFYDVYVDIKSDTTEDSPQLKRLHEDVKLKKFDVVLTKKLGEIAGNGLTAIESMGIFSSHDIDFITLDRKMNSQDNPGIWNLIAWLDSYTAKAPEENTEEPLQNSKAEEILSLLSSEKRDVQ